MKKWRSGFTLIEVSLFLAVTGLLFVGIALGTQNSINQQRSYDSIQNFAEFLKSVYSEVSNPQSVGDGRSDRAIYGKLITFDEEYDLSGNKNDRKLIFVYDVIGDVKGNAGAGEIKTILKGLRANVAIKNGTETLPAGIVESYVPRWQAEIENVGDDNQYHGSVLIVRHPRSGTINTLASDSPVEVNTWIYVERRDESSIEKLFAGQLDSFFERDVDFCINSSGRESSDKRTDIRIVNNAHNASGVEIIGLDDNSPNGNRCRKW